MAQANAALEKLKLKGVAGDTVESTDVENGKVASQDEAAGSDAKEGDTITYHLSIGVGSADAGNHVGETLSEARSELNSAGFTNVNVDDSSTNYSDSYAKGTVMAQSPTGKQSKDTQITLTVSAGPKPAATTNSSSNNNSNSGSNKKPATTNAATTSAKTDSSSESGSEEIAPGN